MIINFYNVGGGGGGGTTNYNQLENKPQINGVTLSGNVSSDQLGITPNELKAVENVPSAATNGSVFAEYREDEVGYGWQYDSATGTAFTFDISLNPYTGASWFTICYFNYNGNSYQAILDYSGGEDQKTFVLPGYFAVSKGEIAENQEFWDSGLHVTVDYSDITKIVLTFDNDVEISDEIAPASSIQVTKELKQAYNVTEQISTEWAYWGGTGWDGRNTNIELRMPIGFNMPSSAVVSNLSYYDILIETDWDGTQFKVRYSLDGGTTWEWAFENTTFDGSGTVNIGPSVEQGRSMDLNYTWYYYQDIDKNCFQIYSSKSMYRNVLENFTNDYNVVYYDQFLKSGASYNVLTKRPSINGNELIGNKTTNELGLQPYVLHTGAEKNWTLQKEVDGLRALNWQNISNIGFSIDFDGSDMPLSFYWENDYGENGQTPYFSGGTWYNTEGSNHFKLSNGKFYFRGENGTKLTGIAQGSITSAVTFYKDVRTSFDPEGWVDAVGNMITVYNGPFNGDEWYSFVSGASRNVKLSSVGDGNLTINYGNNIEETIEISNGDFGDTTGWTWEDDHYYKYTPDLGKLMIFHFGDFYWEIRGGNGNLFINNPDVNGIVTGTIEGKEAYNGMFGPYVYNDVLWEKI